MLLHDVAGVGGECSTDGIEIVLGEEGLHEGGAEMVGYGGVDKESDAFFDGGVVDGGAGEEVIFFLGCFDVHGDVVDEGSIEEFGEELWIAAVGVEFYFELELAEFLAEFEEIGLDGGFAAGDDDGIEELMPFFEEFQSVVAVEAFLSLSNERDEFSVVAIGASEITALGKKDGGYLPGIVAERKGLVAAEEHNNQMTLVVGVSTL